MSSSNISSPSMLNNAHNTTFTGVANVVAGDQINTNNTYYQSGADAVLKCLETHNIPGAAYDSSERERTHARSCLDGTRSEVLSKIMEWVGGGLPIFWLSGPAGTGKSTIAQSIAEQCKRNEKLAGSFFFSRGDPLRDNPTRFFLTLAYQLTILLPSTKASILRALTDDPSIPTKTLETQFKTLIHRPILALGQSISRMVVVVDSLDECVDKDGMLKLIGIIVGAIRRGPFPLSFLFTSRAELRIQAKFRDINTKSVTSVLDLDDYKAHADIRKFLQRELLGIRERRGKFIERELKAWPPAADLELLVEKSEGSFQWASTVVNVIGKDKSIPSEQLRLALAMHAGLDPLYRQVITSARSTNSFDRVIGTIMVLRYPLPVKQIGLLLKLQNSEVRAALEGLESVCKIPQNDRESIRPFHASLYDFFADSERSQEFFVDPVVHHSSVLLDCIRIITDNLKEDEIDQNVTRYVCGSWCHHLNRVLVYGGEDDLLYSEHVGLMMDCLRDMAHRSFRPWFKIALQPLRLGDRDILLECRRDLGSAMAGLRRLPGNPISLFHVLDDLKQRMQSEVQWELTSVNLEELLEREELPEEFLVRELEREELPRLKFLLVHDRAQQVPSSMLTVSRMPFPSLRKKEDSSSLKKKKYDRAQQVPNSMLTVSRTLFPSEKKSTPSSLKAANPDVDPSVTLSSKIF